MPGITDAMLDGGIDKIITATRMTIMATIPTVIGDITTTPIATVAYSGPDFTKANGDVSGRKVTIAAKSGISIGNSGTANYAVWDDLTDWVYADISNPQALTSGGTVSINAHDHEFGDPV